MSDGLRGRGTYRQEVEARAVNVRAPLLRLAHHPERHVAVGLAVHQQDASGLGVAVAAGQDEPQRDEDALTHIHRAPTAALVSLSDYSLPTTSGAHSSLHMSME